MSEEQILWRGKASYRAVVLCLIIGLLLLVIPIIGWISGGLIILFSLCALLQIRVSSYKITDKFVIGIFGLRRQESKIPIKSISNVIVRKPLLMRILGCARLVIEPHSGRPLVFNNITNYETPKSIIEKFMRGN